MPPLVDIHVHLLAGMDDGPRTPEDALEMCRIMVGEGIGLAAACAHQNEDWPDNSPDRIKAGAAQLAEQLLAHDVPLKTFPCAEVMVGVATLDQFQRGELLTVADNRRYLLIEMPHGLCVEVKWLVEELLQRGVRPILGHAERVPEMLHDPGRVEALISAGCLVQVSTKSITDPPSKEDAARLKSWFKRRCVHLLGTDGHSVRRRPPHMADAFRLVQKWIGPEAAAAIGSHNGQAVLEGRPLTVPAPEPPSRSWFAWLR
jgi:protein-tyrosine phosphatase